MGAAPSTEKAIPRVNECLNAASSDGRAAGKVTAVHSICALIVHPGISGSVQRHLTTPANLDTLLLFISDDHPPMVAEGLRLLAHVSNTNNIDIKVVLCERVCPKLVELLEVHDVRVRALAVEALANLLSEESCRTFAAQQNCLPPLIECLGSIHNELLVHSCRAVAALAQSKPLRHQIHSEGGLLPMLALCFIGNMYGLVRYHALRGIANMSKEEALRRDIIAHGIPARLSRLARHEDDMVDPAVRHLVASIFCNFSLAEDTSEIESDEALRILYDLVASDDVDHVVEGIWAIANFCREDRKRRELIETDGVQMLFNLLRVNEVQIWYEVARVLLHVSAGRPGHRKFLIEQGALDAILAIYRYCSEDTGAAPMYRASSERRVAGPEEAEDEEMKVSRVERVEDVEQSARFMTMTVATHALKNLTVFPFARRALMDLAGDKPLMSLLRMEFNAEGQQHAASVLGNMCLNADCCQRLVYDGLIETLIELLKLSTVAGVHQEAAYALANICSISEEYEKTLVEVGIVDALLEVLKQDVDIKVAHSVIRSLSKISIAEAKYDMLGGGVLKYLVHYAQMPAATEDCAFRKACVDLIKSLADLNDDGQHAAMVQAGVLGPLIGILQKEQSDVELCLRVVEIIGTLTIKSDAAKHKALQHPELLPILMQLLQTEDEDLLFHVLTVVGNVAALEDVRAVLGRDERALRAVSRALLVDQFALNLQALRALSYLTMYEPYALAMPRHISLQVISSLCVHSNPTLQRHAVTVVANLAKLQPNWAPILGVQAMRDLKMLIQSDNFDVRREAVRAVANLSLSAQAQQEIDSLNILDNLCEMLKQSTADRGRGNAAQVSSFMGARNLKMQVQVLYALKNLCWTEHMLLRVVKEFDCMPILIQLLESNGIDVRQEAAGCLAVILQRPEQRVFFTALGGPEAALKGLKTSLAITRELDKELTALTRKRDEDQRNRQIEQDLQRQRSIASRATAATTLMGPALLTHEELEAQMLDIQQKTEVKKQNDGLQMEYMRIVYHMAEDEAVCSNFMTHYEWPLFMGPLAVEDAEAQECAAWTNFRLVKAGAKLDDFVRNRGVYYVCRALQCRSPPLQREAAVTLGLIAGAQHFVRHLMEEGGVAMLLAMIQGDDLAALRIGFQAIAFLCAHKELAQMFADQGLLPRLLLVNGAYDDYALTAALVSAIGALLHHEALCKTCLDAGGFQVLMQHCRSDSAQVMRQVLKALITVSSRAESQEPLLQAPHLDTVKAVVQSHRPDCVRDALQVLFNVCAKEQHRDKVYQEAFVAELIPLLDEAKLPDIFSERQTVTYGSQPHLRDLDLVEDEQLLAGAAAPKPGDKTAKDATHLTTAIALLVAKTLGALASLDPVKLQIVNSSALPALLLLFKSEQLEPKWQAVRIMALCCGLEALHEKLAGANLVHQAMVIADYDNAEIKRQAAKIFALLGDNAALHPHFTAKEVLVRIKALAGSKVRDIQISCATALKGLTRTPKIRDSLISLKTAPIVLGFLDAEHQSLKVNGLIALGNMAPGLFVHAKPEDAIWGQTTEVVEKCLAFFRTSPRDSMLYVAALETLCAFVKAHPQTFGQALLDGGGMKDVKAVLMGRPRAVEGGRGPVDLRNVVAQILRAVSAVPECAVPLIRFIGADDIVELLRSEYSECHSVEFVCDVTKAAGNYTTLQAQCDKFIRVGGLKLLTQLLQFQDLAVNHAAAYALGCVTESANTLAKVLAACPLEAMVQRAADETKRVIGERSDAARAADRPHFGAGDESFLSPEEMTLLPYRLLYELSRVLANLADAGEHAERVLFGAAGTQLQTEALEHTLEWGEHHEIRWHQQATLARTLGKVAPPTPTPGQVFAISQLDAMLEALKDRRDLAKVETAMKNLTLLAQRLRPREGAVGDGVRRILDKGVVPTLMAALRTDDLKVFTYAGWALAELGAEHAEVRRQILAEGLATLVKAANNVQDPRRFVASKLLSVTLRQHGAVVTLAKYRLDLRLLGPQAPVAHPHKPHDHD
uniref:Vacuolar protein 8 n=2 Tax=Eutreptiella gymnastica TaxID=73025 RepID=A0A7S4D137_9EUGL